MENKINVAELLKDCPKGMELDCPMFDNVTFIGVDFDNCDYPISISISGERHSLSRYGEWFEDINAKCVIFPKGKTTWEGFVPPCEFKDGDVLFVKALNDWIIIYKENGTHEKLRHYVSTIKNRDYFTGDSFLCYRKDISEIRLATGEEKEKLFKAIEKNGYRWNAETKTLEKLIVPKFKVGDRIKHVVGREEVATVVGVEETHYNLDSKVGTSAFTISLQREWELIPNKFDLSTLKPYKSEILYRNSLGGYWKPAFWGAYVPKNTERHGNHNFLTTSGFAYYCIPFEGNEHLMGKQDDCEEYYKIWEE